MLWQNLPTCEHISRMQETEEMVLIVARMPPGTLDNTVDYTKEAKIPGWL